MNPNPTSFSVWNPPAHNKNFSQFASPTLSVPVSTHFSTESEPIIARNSSLNFHDSSHIITSSHNPSSIIGFSGSLPRSVTPKNEFSNFSENGHNPFASAPESNYILGKFRQQNDSDARQEPISPGGIRKREMLPPRSNTFATLPAIIEKAETPRNDSSDVTECPSPESTYQDLRKTDQTLYERFDESERGSQGKLSCTTTPIPVKDNVAPPSFSFSNGPSLQLQNLSKLIISSKIHEDHPKSATLKSISKGPLIPLVVPMGLNTPSTTRSTTGRNFFGDGEDEDPQEAIASRNKFSSMMDNSFSDTKLPSFTSLKGFIEKDLQSNQPFKFQESLKGSHFAEDNNKTKSGQKEHPMSAMQKPKVARNLFGEGESDDESESKSASTFPGKFTKPTGFLQQPKNSRPLEINPALTAANVFSGTSNPVGNSTKPMSMYEESDSAPVQAPARNKMMISKATSMLDRCNSETNIPQFAIKTPSTNAAVNQFSSGTGNPSYTATKLLISNDNRGPGSKLPMFSGQCNSALLKPKLTNLFAEYDDSGDDQDLPLKSLVHNKFNPMMVDRSPSENFVPKLLPKNNTSLGSQVSHPSAKIVRTASRQLDFGEEVQDMNAESKAHAPVQCMSAMLKPKNLFSSDNGEEEQRLGSKPTVRNNAPAPNFLDRWASENNIPMLLPKNTSNGNSASKNPSLATNDAAAKLTIKHCTSAMLKPQYGQNMFAEYTEQEQQVENKIKPKPYLIGRCSSENNVPSIFSRQFTHSTTGNFAHDPEPSSACSVPKEIDFEPEGSDHSSQGGAPEKEADVDAVVVGENRENRDIEEQIQEQQSMQLAEQDGNGAEISKENVQFGGLISKPKDHRPTFFSQFHPQGRIFKSSTETVLPNVKTGRKNNSFKVERDDWLNCTYEPRFEMDYEIEEVLESKNFEITFLTKNKLDGHYYIVKCVEVFTKSNEEICELLNEIQSLTNEDGEPNHYIVKYYNSWVEDGRLFVVMEECSANLRFLRTQYQVNEGIVVNMLRDVCTALKEIHKSKNIHLHIKPENVLLSKTSKYKLGDLGISKAVYQMKMENFETLDEDIGGELVYFAPELLDDCPREEAPDLTKSDIFSLGVTAYEFMMGIDYRQDEQAQSDIKTANFELLDSTEFSQELKDTLKTMLKENPDERPSAESLLKGFLQRDSDKKARATTARNDELRRQIKQLKQLDGELQIKRKKSL